MPEQGLQWRTQNVGRQLVRAADAFVFEKLRALEKGEFGPIGQAHSVLIQNLDLDGTRLTLAASRARMTKQSMLELVDRAERLGLVERRPDPEDGRAKIVGFTPEGLRIMEGLRDSVILAEERLGTIVGPAFMARMKAKLSDYVLVMEGAGPTLPVLDPQATWRMHNVGRVLATAFGVFTRDVQKTLHQKGFAGVSEGQMSLFRNLDTQGTRPSEIAARARMTKQSMADLVRQTEALKLVERTPDPGDGRAHMIMLTAKGRELLERTREGVERSELGMAEVVGRGFLAEMKRQLVTYVEAVQPGRYPAVGVGESVRSSPDDVESGSSDRRHRGHKATGW